MYIGTQTINDIERRLYIFDCAFEAEEFAELHDGIARAGKDEFGRWIAVI
jgi:hypothetical protein